MKIKGIYQENKDRLLNLFGKSFFHDVVVLGMVIVCLIILLSLFLILTFRIKPTDYLIPLVYNSTYGVTALGSWYKIYSYPLAFAGFLLINLIIAWAYFEKERLISYLSLFITVIIGVLMFIIEFNLTTLIKG